MHYWFSVLIYAPSVNLIELFNRFAVQIPGYVCLIIHSICSNQFNCRI